MLCIVSALGLRALTWTGNAASEGTFYLYNVGAEKFLNNGDPGQSWGTNAYLQAGFGLDIILEANGEAYNLNTNVSNGGTSHYLATSTWCDGAPTPWIFTPVAGQTNVYTISNGDKYLIANNELNDVYYGDLTSADDWKMWWKLVSENDFKAAMQAKVYSTTDPLDVSVFIKGRSFARNDGRNSNWTRTNTGGQFVEGIDNKYYGNEYYYTTFDVYQTLSGMPDGTYEVQCSGFGNTGSTYVYGNSAAGALTTENSAANGYRGTAYRLIMEENAWAGQSSGKFNISDGNIRLGVKNENGQGWTVYDEFRLYYYGLDLSEFAASLATAVSAAEALEGKIPTAAYTNLSASVAALNQTYTTAADYTTATNAVNALVTEYQAMVAPYAIVTEAKALYNQTDYTDAANAKATFKAVVDAADEKTTLEDLNTQIAAIKAAVVPFITTVSLNENAYFNVTNFLVVNPTVSQNVDGWTVANKVGGTGPTTNYGETEFYNATFKFYQTLNLVAGTWEFGVTGFHRAGNHSTYFYAGEDKILIPGVANNIVNSMADAKTYFDNGNGQLSLKFLMEEAADVEIGIDNQDTETDKWTIFRNFTLKYYGAVDYSVYEQQMADAVAAAQAVEGTVPTAVYTTLNDVVTANNKTYTKKADWLAAIQAIQDATTTAKAMQAPYTEYIAVKTAVLAVSGDVNTTSADEAANAATTSEALATASEALRTALKNYLRTTTETNVDLTAALLINPSFENNGTGWTNNGMAFQTNTSFGKDGNVYCEKWQPNGTFSIAQTLTAMPTGVYQLTAKAKARGVTSAKLFANSFEEAITIADSEADYTVVFAIDDNSDVNFGFEGIGTGAGSSWICVDNFRLTLVSAALPDVTAVTGTMNAGAAAAQNDAIAAYNANKTVANYNAAVAAIAAAQASIDAYAQAPAIIAAAKTLQANHNFASETAITTFADAITATETAYNNGTLTDAQAANGNNLGTTTYGWHAARAEADWTVAEAFMQDAWTGAEYNDWSIEGETDGSNFLVPFFQNWVADDNSLGEGTTQGQLTSLPNGLYKVSALIRVRAKNGVDAADATGITMTVNEGTSVDVTEGTVVDGTQFSLATFEAEGLVKDGTLNVVINRAGDNNISWLSFKNIQYIKERDLTPEEESVAPTAIVLKNGEDVVSDPIALDATTSTVTLTPSYTPAEATEGYLTWASSDETVATVANGVVTAVSTGTATITATSTLAPAVSASATVTVSFPESTVPASVEVASGSSMSVTTLSSNNLFKNGSFGYPNAVAGWKTIGYTTDAIASNFTISVNGGVNDGAYITTNGGGTGSANTIRKSVEVEVGKKYYFSVYTSGKAPTSANLKYNALFAMSDATTESGTIKEFEWPQGAGNTTTEWSKTECIFEATTPYVGVRMGWNQNSSFDEFVLVEVVDESVVGNVQYALDAIPTANIGTAPFQYSQDAIDAANALVQGTASVADVEGVYEALTTVNAPADGQLFNVVLTYAGWTYNNKAMTYIANGRSDAGLYNIQYKEVANKNLAQAFTFTKVSGNNYKMSQIDADGNVRYICTGQPYGGNSGQIRTTTNADDALQVTIIPTATEGVYNLRNVAANQYIGSQDAGVFTVNSHIDFFIVETEKPVITINTTAAGWGTTMLPFAVTSIPEGVKVYSCATVDGDVLTLTEVDAIEANKPYIIEGAWSEDLTGDAQGVALTYTDGLLTGVYAAQSAPNESYVLQKNGGKVGFYQVDEAVGLPTVGANRAYLTAPAGGEVKVFFLGTDADAIRAIEAEEGNDVIYNLAGQRVSKAQKGIFIKNGKKVVVK